MSASLYKKNLKYLEVFITILVGTCLFSVSFHLILPCYNFDALRDAAAAGIVLKTGPVIEPVRSLVQVFTGQTIGSPVHCLVF
jgi:hypothetical protein